MFRTIAAKKASGRARSIGRILSTCVVVFIVAILIGGGWFLFFRQTSPTSILPASAPIGPAASPITSHSQVNGIEASMQVTAGPYFLGELLEANLSLTNHTKTTLTIEGYSGGICGSLLFVNPTGGNSPQYAIPVLTSGFLSCPPPGFTQFKPGQTIKASQDIPLTKSGNVKLTMDARFYHMGTNNSQGKSPSSVFDPLAGHWPLLQLAVASHLPPDRVISLQWRGTQVNINAPASARPNLRYFFVCRQGNDETGNFTWAPLAKPELDISQCAGPVARWNFAVGAPGYVIVNGKSPF